jgi:hypothetical protein
MSNEILSRYNLDGKEIGKNVLRYERIISDDLRGDPKSRIALEDAWAAYVAESQAFFDTQGESLMVVLDAYKRTVLTDGVVKKQQTANVQTASLPTLVPIDSSVSSPTPPVSSPSPPTAKAFANALSEMCFLGEAYYAKSFGYIKCAFGSRLATAATIALSSPSRVLRLLGLLCSRIFAPNLPFLSTLSRERGIQWLALCFDRELSNETEYALGFLLRLADLKLRDKLEWVDQYFPQSLALRIASMLDVADQLNTLNPQTRLQCCRVAVQVLEAFPRQVAGADLIRTLLVMCTQKGIVADEANSILRAVLHLVDSPTSRAYVRDADISTLFAPFFENPSKEQLLDAVGRMNQSRDVLCKMLCTWPGLLWIGSESMCLRALADLLHLPGPMDRKMVILNLVQSVLVAVAPHRGIPPPTLWTGPNEGRRRASTQAPTDFDMVGADEVGDTAGQGFELYLDTEVEDEDDLVPTTKSIGYFASDIFCASLLLVFVHHGIPQALITIAKRSQSSACGYEPEVAHGATVLLQHMLVLMDNLLPPATVAPLHDAFTGAVAGLYSEHNGTSDSLLSSVVGGAASGASTFMISSSAPLFMDDAVFQTNLKESHVEQHNEPSRWNFDILLLLVQGPLRVPARVRWARDNTRFFTRILGFYKPSALKSFATLRREECTDEICGFGVAMVETLLACKEGAEMLERSDFPKALRQMLQELVEDKSPTIMTWERVGPGSTKVGTVFLMMLGRFTQSANGLQLLKKYDVLKAMGDLIVKLNRGPEGAATSVRLSSGGNDPALLLSEVGHKLLRHMHLGSVPNFGVCEDLRLVASHALDNKVSNSLRLCALSQLRKILWRDLSTAMRWGISRLVETLSDTSSLLVEQSFRMLASICCSSVQALDYLISLKPLQLVQSQVLKENAKKWSTSSLLYRMAGRREGAIFLRDAGWIQRELELWRKSENAYYCEEVERMSQGKETPTQGRHFSSRSQYHTRSDSTAHRIGGTPAGGNRNRGVSFAASSAAQNYFPIHLVAELCRTREGCELVQRHSLWQDAVATFLAECTEAPISPESPGMNVAESSTFAYTMPVAMPMVSPAVRKVLSTDEAYADDVQDASRIGWRGDASGEAMNDVDVTIISAARGYEGINVHHTIDTNYSDLQPLKQAMLLIANAASSANGFEMVTTCLEGRGELLRKLLELAHYANTLSLRGVSMVCLAIMSRSPTASSYLIERHYAVVQSASAYVSASGLPYSVAFAHPLSHSWMGVQRAALAKGLAPRNAYIEGNADPRGVSKDIAENSFALSNPVNRESAKMKLHGCYKEHPESFTDVNTQRLLLDTTNMFRLKSGDRKFVAELLQRSMVSQPSPHVHSEPDDDDHGRETATVSST